MHFSHLSIYVIVRIINVSFSTASFPASDVVKPPSCMFLLIGLILKLCISDLRIWMIRSKLRINDSKTEFLIITPSFLKQRCDYLNVMIGGSNIVSSNSARNLGVIFDKCMKHDYHISSVCKSTYFHLRNIGNIRRILFNDACVQLIHSLVTVRLDYCTSI